MSTDLFPSATPADLRELVEAIGELVRDQFATNERAIDGSFLAHLVREKYPLLDYEDIGIKRLGDAVEFAESAGLVVRHRDVKHLLLSPPAPGAEKTRPADQRPYVKSDVWRAVVVAPKKVSYIHRDTLEVIERPDGPHSEDDPSLVRINPVSDEQQAHWAKLFSKLYPEELNADSPAVINALVRGGARSYPPEITRAWVSFRSAKIIDHIRDWARAAELDEKRILLPPESRKKKHLTPHGPPQPHEAGPSGTWRNAVLAAIQEMSDEELERLALPLRHIRKHFSPK